MAPPEGAKIIRVLLPDSSEIRAYFDRSTLPGEWRDADTDEIVTEWTDGLIVRATLYGGQPFECYWNAASEWAWKGVNDNPEDVALTQYEVSQIDLIDLTGG